MRDALLIIHILAVALWLGGSVMNGVLNAKVAATGDTGANATLARVETTLGTQFYMPMAVLTLLSGIGLVLVSDGAYSFGDVFVSVGFLAIIAAAVLGPVKFQPLSERIADAFETGDLEAGAAASKEIAMWSSVSTGLIVLATILMVLRTGAS